MSTSVLLEVLAAEEASVQALFTNLITWCLLVVGCLHIFFAVFAVAASLRKNRMQEDFETELLDKGRFFQWVANTAQAPSSFHAPPMSLSSSSPASRAAAPTAAATSRTQQQQQPAATTATPPVVAENGSSPQPSAPAAAAAEGASAKTPPLSAAAAAAASTVEGASAAADDRSSQGRNKAAAPGAGPAPLSMFLPPTQLSADALRQFAGSNTATTTATSYPTAQATTTADQLDASLSGTTTARWRVNGATYSARAAAAAAAALASPPQQYHRLNRHHQQQHHHLHDANIITGGGAATAGLNDSLGNIAGVGTGGGATAAAAGGTAGPAPQIPSGASAMMVAAPLSTRFTRRKSLYLAATEALAAATPPAAPPLSIDSLHQKPPRAVQSSPLGIFVAAWWPLVVIVTYTVVGVSYAFLRCTLMSLGIALVHNVLGTAILEVELVVYVGCMVIFSMVGSVGRVTSMYAL